MIGGGGVERDERLETLTTSRTGADKCCLTPKRGLDRGPATVGQ